LIYKSQAPKYGRRFAGSEEIKKIITIRRKAGTHLSGGGVDDDCIEAILPPHHLL